MSTQGSNPISIILKDQNDWDEWIGMVKTKAITGDIWEHVDPSTTRENLPQLQQPQIPTPNQVNPERTLISQLTEDEKEQLSLLRYEYKIQRKEYDRKKIARANLRSHIQGSISRDYLTYTLKCDDAHEMLVALKKRAAPTDQARKLILTTKYKILVKAPREISVDSWLRLWEKTYADCKELKLSEVDDDKPLHDFITAIDKIDSGFASTWRIMIEDRLFKEQPLPDFYGLVERFRNHHRLTEARKGKSTQASFSATFQGQPLDDPKPKEPQNQQKPPCVCGDFHRYAKCPYLNESARQANWKPNPTVQQKVDNKLKNDSRLRTTIERAKRQSQAAVPRSSSSANQAGSSTQSASTDQPPQGNNDQLSPTAFTTVASVSSVPFSHRPQNSFIYDGGATMHICHDRKRFRDYKPAPEGHAVAAGKSLCPIMGYGTVTITVQTPSGPRKIDLLDTALIPDFLINVVSGDKLDQREVFFDGESQHLKYHGNTFCQLQKIGGLWIMEHNPLNDHLAFAARSAQPRTASEASPQVWHERLGHPQPDAIEHLSTAVAGTKLSKGPSTIECEVCSLSKAHRRISRRPAAHSTKPFERVHLDLVQMTYGFNHRRWFIHFLCDHTRMNHVDTLPQKSGALQSIKDFAAWIRNRYDISIRFLHLDGETSLGNAFNRWIAKKGITVEQSAPYTPEQNGAAERSGGVIIFKARSMRIGARLPEDLWPETVVTATYLVNRTPSKQLGWKTPLETLHVALGSQDPIPQIVHLKAYGCRAYALNHHLPRTKKLQPRAHIGYLVGYESSNIYRVWIPSERKVILTRDVTFDETLFYDSKEKDLAGQLQERSETLVQTVDVPTSTRQSEVTLSDTDSESDTDDESLPSTQPKEASKERDQQDPLDDSENDTILSEIRVKSGYTPSSTETTPTPSVEDLTGRPLLSSNPDTTESPYSERSTNDSSEGYYTPTGESSRGISADLDERNIIDGPRTRNTSRRAEAYHAALARPHELPGFHAAFAAGFHHRIESLHRDHLPKPPKHWKSLQSHPHREGFLAAIEKEYRDLERRNTFSSVPTPVPHQPLPLMWVFTYKFDTDGYLSKYKARLCVRGDLEPPNQTDNYAATLAARTFRSMMAVAAAFDLEAHQLDAVNAFTNSQLDDTIYCEHPDGFKKQGSCLLLHRALYGLRRSPRLWHNELSKTLTSLGLHTVADEPCLFTSHQLVVFFYVDDLITLCRKTELLTMEHFKEELTKRYELRDLGPLNWFLGIRILRNRSQRKLWLSQDSYIEKIAKAFHLTERRPPPTPMATGELRPSDRQATQQEIHVYQRKVGHLLYATAITRADAAFAGSKLSEFLTNPSRQHDEAASRAISYLYGTKNRAMLFTASTEDSLVFHCSSDAAFADDPTTRKSSEGYLFHLFGGPIDWRASKQKTVTTSSTEAELLALSRTAKEAFAWERFFDAISFDPGHDLSIACDNQQTIGLMVKGRTKLVTKLRHVDIHQHWLRQEVQNGRRSIHWVPTADMPADGLTKPLNRQNHERFVKQLGLTYVDSHLLTS